MAATDVAGAEVGAPPVLTVFVPVKNEAHVIDEQLAALATQDMAAPWELIVADTGSTDDTVERVKRWQAEIPWLTVVETAVEDRYAVPEAALAVARSPHFAFCDGDDVVGHRWVSSLHRALAEHELVTGPLELRRLNPSWVLRGEPVTALNQEPYADHFLPFALGCNIGIRRDTFERHGAFDPALESGVDKDLCWRLQLAGVDLHFAPDAVVHRRMRAASLGALHQYRRYGRSNARLFGRYRPHGLRRDPLWRVLAIWVWVLVTAPGLVRRAHRLHWCRVVGLRAGRLEGSVLHRVWFP